MNPRGLVLEGYFKKIKEIPIEIERLKNIIRTNPKCRQVAKFRALLKKRDIGGFELPEEPDYRIKTWLKLQKDKKSTFKNYSVM